MVIGSSPVGDSLNAATVAQSEELSKWIYTVVIILVFLYKNKLNISDADVRVTSYLHTLMQMKTQLSTDD